MYTDEIAVIHNWATAVNLISISAVFDQGTNAIYETDSLEKLKRYLTVTASYDDGTSSAVSGYTLSGELAEGASTVTVAYGGKTTTFSVMVSEAPLFDPDTAPTVSLSVQTNTMKYMGGNYAASYIPCVGGKTYKIQKDVSNCFRIGTSEADPVDGGTVLQTDANHSGSEITITTASSANYLLFAFYTGTDSTVAQAVRNSIVVTRLD